MRLPDDDLLLRLRAAPRREVAAKPVPEEAREASERRTFMRSEFCRVISSFAKLCNRLARGRDAADVLAVDAYAYDYSRQFDEAAKCLHRELRGSSTSATAIYPWNRVSIPHRVLPEGSRELMSIRGSR